MTCKVIFFQTETLTAHSTLALPPRSATLRLMRLFFFILGILATPVAAAEATALLPAQGASPSFTLQPPPAVPEVQIIQGKKFFSLSNARQYINTSPTPHAMAIANHPRPATRSSAETEQRAKEEPPIPEGNDVLSVFAPEDRTPTPLMTKP